MDKDIHEIVPLYNTIIAMEKATQNLDNAHFCYNNTLKMSTDGNEFATSILEKEQEKYENALKSWKEYKQKLILMKNMMGVERFNLCLDKVEEMINNDNAQKTKTRMEVYKKM